MHSASRYIAGLMTLSALLFGVAGVVADEGRLHTAIELLAAKSYNKTIEGVDNIAASGADHAPAILTALAKRRVYLNNDTKAAAYRTGRSYFDFLSGAPLKAKPSGAKSVRVNNRVRSAIKAALGTLELRAKDPARRLSAAAEVFRRKDTGVLPALTKLLETESDPTVKRAFIEARSALILAAKNSSKPDKLIAFRPY